MKLARSGTCRPVAVFAAKGEAEGASAPPPARRIGRAARGPGRALRDRRRPIGAGASGACALTRAGRRRIRFCPAHFSKAEFPCAPSPDPPDGLPRPVGRLRAALRQQLAGRSRPATSRTRRRRRRHPGEQLPGLCRAARRPAPAAERRCAPCLQGLRDTAGERGAGDLRADRRHARGRDATPVHRRARRLRQHRRTRTQALRSQTPATEAELSRRSGYYVRVIVQ